MWPTPNCAGRDCVTPKISAPAQLGQGRMNDATILPFHSEQGARQSRTRGRSGASNRSIWIGGLLVGTVTCMGLVWQLRERGEAALQASLVVAAATPVAHRQAKQRLSRSCCPSSLGPRRCGQARRRGAEPQALRAGPSRRRLRRLTAHHRGTCGPRSVASDVARANTARREFASDVDRRAEAPGCCGVYRSRHRSFAAKAALSTHGPLVLSDAEPPAVLATPATFTLAVRGGERGAARRRGQHRGASRS